MARIAIVGAGPAGSSAGYHLATRGHAVTLIDRAEFPRNKTCGDWITSGAVRELARMGIDRAGLERLAPERAVISTTVLASPDGRRSVGASRESAYCIPRRVFDAILWQRAVGAGCRPVRRTVGDLAAGDDGYLREFDSVIDARGAHAGRANAVGLRAYWTVGRNRLEPHDASSVQIYTDPVFRRGYGWIFPVHVEAETVRFNVGVGLWKADKAPGHDVADFFARFVGENEVASRLRDGALSPSGIGRPVGYHVALGSWRNRVADGGVLRIGDAANLADPLTGDGIGNALKSGYLVAEAFDHGADAAAAAKRWQRLHDRAFAGEFRWALMFRQALAGTCAKNLTGRLLDRAPALCARVHAAFFGDTTYRAMLGLGD